MRAPLRHLGSLFAKHQPVHLTVFVTRRCNAGCPYCFYLRGGGAGHAATAPPRPEELSLDEIRAVSNSLGPLLWVSFSGGEPFLRPDLPDIARAFHDRNHAAFMVFPTNGLKPRAVCDATEHILRACPRSVVAVKLSLDGIGGLHDRLRRSPGGFDRVMETHRRLAGLLGHYPNLELGFNTVLLSENQDHIDEIIDFVAALWPPATHTVSLVRGDLAKPGYAEVVPGVYARAAARLAEGLRDGASAYRFRGARLKLAQDVVQRRMIERVLGTGRRPLDCRAGRLSLVLTEAGDVFPCELSEERLGNVREHGHDMGRLLRSGPARRALGTLREAGCACTHECNMLINVLSGPRAWPALAAQYLALGGAGGAAVQGPAVGPQPEQAHGAAADDPQIT